MIPSDVLGMLRPAPEDCSRGAVTVTNPSFERAAAAAHNPGDRIPSSFVNRICGLDFVIIIRSPIGLTNKKERISAPKKGALGATRHATYCSASKRSNPLSYEGQTPSFVAGFQGKQAVVLSPRNSTASRGPANFLNLQLT